MHWLQGPGLPHIGCARLQQEAWKKRSLGWAVKPPSRASALGIEANPPGDASKNKSFLAVR